MAWEENLAESLSEIFKSRSYKITKNQWMRSVIDLEKVQNKIKEYSVLTLIGGVSLLIISFIIIIFFGIKSQQQIWWYLIIGMLFLTSGLLFTVDFIISRIKKKINESIQNTKIPDFLRSGRIVVYSSSYEYSSDDLSYFLNTVTNTVLSSIKKLLFDINSKFKMVEYPEQKLSKRFIVKGYSFLSEDIPVMVNLKYIFVEKVNFFIMEFRISLPEAYEIEYSEIVEKIKSKLSEEMIRILR